MRRKSRKPLVSLCAVVGGLMLVASACGSSSNNSSSGSSTSAATSASSSTSSGAGSTAPNSSTAGSSSGGSSTSGGGAPTGKPFKVLAILPTSGPIASIGKFFSDSLQAEANLLNAKDGIAGRPVEIVTVDDALDAQKAVAAFQDYISKNDKPDMLIPGLTSQEIVAVLPLATREKVFSLQVSADAANDPQKYPYSFDVAVTASSSSQSMADIFAEKGYKKVAFIGPDVESSRTVSDALGKDLAAKNIGYDPQFIDPTTVDASATMLKLQEGSPDVLAMSGTGPIIGTMFAARTKIGWDVPVLGEPNLAGNSMNLVSDPKDWTGVQLLTYQFAVKGSAQTQTPAFKAFYDEYVKVAGKAPENIFTSAVVAADFLIITKGAYEAAATADAPGVQAALEQNKVSADIRNSFFGPTEWDYSPTNHALSWSKDDLLVVPAAPTVDGLITPSS
jgi:branched-chain amino acid transport system substrate-binding protein